MTIRPSLRNISLAASIIALLGLSACAAQNGKSRYGDCSQPCMSVYQPAYTQSYYQVPVQAPAPVQVPAPRPEPIVYSAPTVTVSTPPPAISCPAGTVQQSNGSCLQTHQPVYTPPITGYIPDPITPARIYRPVRK